MKTYFHKKYLIIIPLIGLIFFSCDLFTTREPESPSGISDVWTPPVNPQEVLRNISDAFEQKNGVLYMKSFAQDIKSDSAFIFIPDYAASVYDTNIFTGWDYNSEESFIFKLFSPSFLPDDSAATIQFIPESEPPGELSAVFHESYIITLHHIHQNLPISFSGRAEIQFIRDYTGSWVINRWIDENSGSQPNMTILKASL
ncbi:hypothetical protein ISS30_02080 [bacterium]|nr:hypothetical protein [FCB group bacterium]MBL7190455.1 hypothetical protein [bacterium]